jgi:hypothetical protein
MFKAGGDQRSTSPSHNPIVDIQSSHGVSSKGSKQGKKPLLSKAAAESDGTSLLHTDEEEEDEGASVGPASKVSQGTSIHRKLTKWVNKDVLDAANKKEKGSSKGESQREKSEGRKKSDKKDEKKGEKKEEKSKRAKSKQPEEKKKEKKDEKREEKKPPSKRN